MIKRLKWTMKFKYKAMQIYAKILSWIFFCCTYFSLFLLSFNSIYSTGISGQNGDIKTWPLADLSGYFVIGFDSSSIAKICKYTFSSSNAQCQTITNINYGYGHLMISNSQFFVLGASSTSPYNLQMYKITFSSTSVNWANQIACPSGTWSAYRSESVLSSDGSTVYSFFLFGPSSTTRYLYFCGLSVSDGSVRTTRYKSGIAVSSVLGSALNGDYVVATTYSPISLLIYSISSLTFTIKSFLGFALYGCGVEPSSGR